jgi:hypothetical protein
MTKDRVELHSNQMLVERTADPSTSVGMTKGGSVLSSGSIAG